MISTRHSVFGHAVGETHYQRVGPEEGDDVVLVPGATLPLAVWDPLMEPLTREGFRVLRYDLPGRGHSTPIGRPQGLASDVSQLAELLDGLGVRRPIHLVGLASGALSATAFALEYPERVSRVALVCPDGMRTRFTLGERLSTAPVIGEALLATVGRRVLLARAARYSENEEVRSFVRDLLTFALDGASFPRSVLEYVRALPLGNAFAWYARLARSSASVKIVWGGDDRITPASEAARLRELFGASSVEVIDGVGHLPFVERPEQVAALLATHFRT